MGEGSVTRRRMVDAVAPAVVSALSLLLLIYVGYGEARRTYEQFHLEKLVAQNKVLQGAIETFLRQSLPLEQYVGFSTRAEGILASDDTIAMMAVFDGAGGEVFVSGNADIGLLPHQVAAEVATDSQAEVRRSEAYIQVVLPLSDGQERLGSLAITMPRSVVSERVWTSFQPLTIPAIGLSILFACFVSMASPWLARQRAPWPRIVYGLMFAGMALVVIGTLVSLYSEGAQAKTKALADSLAQRLTQIVGFQLDLDQIAGLDEAFVDYRRLNPEISAAALIVDDEVVLHTDPTMIGRRWVSRGDAYEYVVEITPPDSSHTIRTAVALPADVVHRRVARSVKNFAALFIATGFLAGVFLQLAGSMQRRRPARAEASAPDEQALDLVKPVFYVAMCVEHLTYAFLPQFVYDAVSRAALPSGCASAIFMGYYLCFALTLVPAGHYAQRVGQRPLMAGGLALVAIGLLMLPLGVGGIAVGRAVGGIGQGMLFIGVQSYILAVASPGRKTQGAAIIVFGFQGGMISGMAIGSLLVGYVGPDAVFSVGAVAAAVMTLYAAVVVPAAEARRVARGSFAAELAQLAHDVGQTLSNRDLLDTIGLIGMPAKAVLTGVIVFALPLLMALRGYAHEDIGQVVMIYAAGVVLASGWASRVVDRSGRSALVLFAGAVVSGLGLMLMALMAWPGSDGRPPPDVATLETVALIAGVLIVGLAHGLINAPIVTHVAELDVARRIGIGSATAAYRFLERAGHVAGPIIVGQLFLLSGRDPALLAWIGGAVALFGLIFVARRGRRHPTTLPVTRIEIEHPNDVVGLYMDARDLALVLSTGPIGTAHRRDRRASPEPDHAPPIDAEGLGGFLGQVAESVPPSVELHVVLASTSRHRTGTATPLAGHPRHRLHRLSSAAEWHVQMKHCLSGVVEQRGGAGVRGARQLAAAIATHFEAHRGLARSFVWIAPALATRATVRRPTSAPAPPATPAVARR